MQKLLLIVSLFFLLPASFAHAGIAQPPTTRGLVGYWSMEDCKLTKATDNSGQGNTGTLTNFALTGAASNWVAGRLGACALNFDGNNDYVSAGTSTAIGSLTTNVTVGAWINSTNLVGIRRIVGASRAATSNGFTFGTSGAGLLFTTFSVKDYTSTTITLSTNTWTHVVAVMSGFNVTYYVNGASAQTITGTANGNANTDDPLYIGASTPFGSSALQEVFSGSIDEVRIYNRALTGNEIARLYGGGASHAKPATTRGLVGHWSFEDCKLNKASDDSGRGNTGTLTNFALTGATSNWVAGKRGACALNFDGSDDYVLGSNTLNAGSILTVSAWVNPSTLASIRTILGWTTSGGPQLRIETTGAVSWIKQNIIAIGTGTTGVVGVNSWQHIVGVYNSSTGAYSFYVNGQPAGSGSSAQALTYSAPQIGRHGLNTEYMAGSLDDVRVYNRALTGNEISDLYNSSITRYNTSTTALQTGTSLASGLVGHWTFDGANLTSTKAKDSTTNLNHGTLTGANGLPRPIMGQLGQALTFDGVDDYVNVPDSSALRPGTADFTYSMWIKPPDQNQAATTLLAKALGAPTYNQVFLGVGSVDSNCGAVSSKRIAFAVVENATNNLGCSMTTTDVVDGLWHHIVLRRASGVVEVYVDGVSRAYTSPKLSGAGHAGNINNSQSLQLGTTNGVFNYLGSLDDVRVYNRALSASEVTQLYNLGR